MFNKIIILCSLLFPAAFASALTGSEAGSRELVPQSGGDGGLGISFSPDGEIAAWSSENSISLGNKEGYLLRRWPVSSVIKTKFSNTGKFLASIQWSSNVILWDPLSGGELDHLDVQIPGKAGLRDLDFNPDDSLVAIAIGDSVSVLDIARRRGICNIIGHDNDPIQRVYFADAGKAIVTNSASSVRIWDLQGRLIKELPVNGVIDIDVNKAGREVFCRSTDTVTVFNFAGELLAKFFVAEASSPKSVYDSPLIRSPKKIAYLPGKDIVLTLGFKGLQGWTRRGSLLWEYPRPGENCFGKRSPFLEMAVSPNIGRVALTGCSRRILDTESMTMQAFSAGAIEWITDFALFPENTIVTSSMRKFDLTGKLKPDLAPETGFMAVSPDGGMLAISSMNGLVKIFDRNWKLLNKFIASSEPNFPIPVSFSPDSKKLAMLRFDRNPSGVKHATDPDFLAVIREVPSGRILGEMRLHEGQVPVPELQFMPDGKTLLVGGGTHGLRLVDIETKKTRRVLIKQLSDVNLNTAIIGEKFFGYSQLGSLRLWDLKGNSLPGIELPKNTGRWGNIAAYNPKTGLAALGGDSGSIGIIDLAAGKAVKILTSHQAGINRLKFSPNGLYLYSSSGDGVLKIWNTNNWNNVSILSTSNNEWLIYTPDGYFDASPHGGELVSMVSGFKAYGVDQFAARNNRPDLIYERMGLGTPEQISHYQVQYQKRLRELGLNEALLSDNLHVPEAKITKTVRKGKFLDVGFLLSDDAFSLKRYNIFVNDVPLFGSAGKEIQGGNFAGEESVELTAGKNKIELSVMNEAGVESYRALTKAEYSGGEKQALYYLAFGVSRYRDHSRNLSYADKDARDLAAVVSGMTSAYSKVYAKTFLNSDVTAENIKKAKNFLKQAGVDDTVILFLAGHGGYSDGKDPEYYYMPYETNFENPVKTGIAFEAIEDLLRDIKPRKKLFLLDTCESGELEEDVFSRYYAAASARGFKPRTFRKPAKGRGARKTERRGYLLEKDRFIYNDLARRSGAIVFSSSRGNEMSYESSTIKNGFFSGEIIKAFKNKAVDTDRNGKVSVDELRAYVSETVSQKTGGLQNPEIGRDNLSQKIEFPLVGN